MHRDFIPYSNLWNTVHGWIVGSEIWINDAFDTVDALACQKFVEDGVKHL
jgi:hypothetical protein